MKHRSATLFGFFLLACSCASPVWGAALAFVEVDCAKVERRIAKEPKYVSQPLYALFIFDLEGKNRTWAVLDNSKADLPYYDVLYLDLKGNGDLTEPGKRFVGKFDEKLAPAGLSLSIRVDKLPVPGTDLVHTDFLLATVPKSAWKGIWFQMKWAGKQEMSGGYGLTGFDTTIWAKAPQTAPVLRPTPLGTLSFALWGSDNTTLTISGTNHLNFLVGKPGSGPDTLCVVDEHFLVPGKDRLFATVIATDSSGKEVRERTEIKKHC